MSTNGRTVPYELHLTVAPLTLDQLPGFERACQLLGGRAVWIELARGSCMAQPMLSKQFDSHCLAAAIAYSEQIKHSLAALQFDSRRLKLEIPIAHASTALEACLEWHYLEFHLQVLAQRMTNLEQICLQHEAHLSQNRLAGASADIRFVTYRHYADPAQSFEAALEQFLQATLVSREKIEQGGWPTMKAISEVCVYDSKLDLDQGWLHAST